MDNDNIISELKKVVEAEDDSKVNISTAEEQLKENIDVLKDLKDNLSNLGNFYTTSKGNLEVNYYIKTDMEGYNTEFRNIGKQIYACCQEIYESISAYEKDKTTCEEMYTENENRFEELQNYQATTIMALEQTLNEICQEQGEIKRQKNIELVDENKKLKEELNTINEHIEKIANYKWELNTDSEVMNKEIENVSSAIEIIQKDQMQMEQEKARLIILTENIDKEYEKNHEVEDIIKELDNKTNGIEADMLVLTQTQKQNKEYSKELLKKITDAENVNKHFKNEYCKQQQATKDLEQQVADLNENSEKEISNKLNLIKQKENVLLIETQLTDEMKKNIEAMTDRISKLDEIIIVSKSELAIKQETKPKLIEESNRIMEENKKLQSKIENITEDMYAYQQHLADKQIGLKEIAENRKNLIISDKEKTLDLQNSFLQQLKTVKENISEIETNNKKIQDAVGDCEQLLRQLKNEEIEIETEKNSLEFERKTTEKKYVTVYTEIKENVSKIKQINSENKRGKKRLIKFTQPKTPKKHKLSAATKWDSDSSVDEKFSDWKRNLKRVTK